MGGGQREGIAMKASGTVRLLRRGRGPGTAAQAQSGARGGMVGRGGGAALPGPSDRAPLPLCARNMAAAAAPRGEPGSGLVGRGAFARPEGPGLFPGEGDRKQDSQG